MLNESNVFHIKGRQADDSYQTLRIEVPIKNLFECRAISVE